MRKDICRENALRVVADQEVVEVDSEAVVAIEVITLTFLNFGLILDQFVQVREHS